MNSNINIFPANLKSRQNYVNRLLTYIGQGLIKVLVGQRRVGKSYILFLLMKHLSIQKPGVKFIYLNLEDLQYDFISDYKSLHTYIDSHIKDSDEYAVIIDEIQNVEGFEKVLRSLLLRGNIDLYITGSNSKMLSGELATVLTGRYIEIQVGSLSYNEFLEFQNLNNSDDALNKGIYIFSRIKYINPYA